jgi:hypothetical protein
MRWGQSSQLGVARAGAAFRAVFGRVAHINRSKFLFFKKKLVAGDCARSAFALAQNGALGIVPFNFFEKPRCARQSFLKMRRANRSRDSGAGVH